MTLTLVWPATPSSWPATPHKEACRVPSVMNAAATAVRATSPRETQNALSAAARPGSWWKKTAPRSATPNVPPSCCTALRSPAADPVSGGLTRCSAAVKNGVVKKPTPSPETPSEINSAHPALCSW
jgi:hypothetical protein